MQNKILILDSGIGGFSLAKTLESDSSNIGIPTQIIYYSDASNFPYGNKSYEELKIIISNTIEKITQIHPSLDLIIIACNTASIIINHLCQQSYKLFSPQKTYKNIPIIDIISNLKTLMAKEENLTVIATKITANYLSKSQQFHNCKILELKELARLIEFNEVNKIEAYLKQSITYEPKKIAYGCTHFPLAHKIFKQLFQCQYFDPSFITLNQIKSQLSTSRKFILSTNLDQSQLSTLNNSVWNFNLILN